MLGCRAGTQFFAAATAWHRSAVHAPNSHPQSHTAAQLHSHVSRSEQQSRGLAGLRAAAPQKPQRTRRQHASQRQQHGRLPELAPRHVVRHVLVAVHRRDPAAVRELMRIHVVLPERIPVHAYASTRGGGGMGGRQGGGGKGYKGGLRDGNCKIECARGIHRGAQAGSKSHATALMAWLLNRQAPGYAKAHTYPHACGRERGTGPPPLHTAPCPASAPGRHVPAHTHMWGRAPRLTRVGGPGVGAKRACSKASLARDPGGKHVFGEGFGPYHCRCRRQRRTKTGRSARRC
eukprot:365377-Chlamydomonas_euryale.AAC.10